MSAFLQSIEWRADYNIGNEKIDRQHRMLCELVNEVIHSSNENSKINERLLIVVTFMGNYVEFHFNDEEAIQIKCSYPEYESHKKIHDNFRAVIKNYIERYKKEPASRELLGELIEAARGWLLGHIQGEDQKIKNYL